VVDYVSSEKCDVQQSWEGSIFTLIFSELKIYGSLFSISLPLVLQKGKQTPDPSPDPFVFSIRSMPFHILPPNPHHKVLNLPPFHFLILYIPSPCHPHQYPISQPRKNYYPTKNLFPTPRKLRPTREWEKW
jgi:hypothetical protein